MTLVKSLQACIVATSALVAAGAANAGSISTPSIFLGGGNQIVCTAVVTSGAALSVTVTIVGLAATDTDTCTIGPDDAGGCQAFRTDDSGYCRITVAGLTNAQVAARVRGTLFSRRTTSPFTVFSQVEAR